MELNGLKSHSIGRDDFWHQLLLMIIRHMFEGQPSPYGPMDSVPQPKDNNFRNDRKKTLRSFKIKR